MIPEKRGDINQVSTLDGEIIPFTLDDDPEHLMGILTNIYADPETAVIREYSTNAWDSHVEAEIERPIEVTTPSALQPNLLIQDFGVGLDIDDMRRIYTKYGASTKRESDKVVGMLGIGSKSALALVDQFSVVSIKNGKKIQASVAQNENGVPELTVVSEKETEEENGVQIIIPVKRSSDLDRKAATLFQYWPKGSVLLNGKEPKTIIGTGIKLNNKLQIIEDEEGTYYGHDDNRHVLVMGNVPYPLKLKNILSYKKKLIVWADINDIHFAPDREEMADTKKTRLYKEEIAKELKSELSKRMNNITKDIKNSWEVIPALFETANLFYDTVDYSEFTWNGKQIPSNYKIGNPYSSDNIGKFWVANQSHYTTKMHGNQQGILESHAWHRMYFISNFALKKFNKLHGEKLNTWYEETTGNTDKITFVLFPGEIPQLILDWIDPSTVADWKEDVLPVTRKINKTTSKPQDMYDTIVDNSYIDRGVSSDELSKAKKAFWFYRPVRSREEYDRELRRIKRIITVLKSEYPTAEFALVEGNRLTRLEKLVPNIERGDTGLRALYDKWAASLSDDETAALYGRIDNERTVQTLSNILSKITIADPEIKKITKRYEKIAKIRKDKQDLMAKMNSWNSLGFSLSTEELDYGTQILNKYPLLEHNYYAVSDDLAKDVEIYINAKYNTTKKGQ